MKIVPPGGVAGLSQMTTASKHALSSGVTRKSTGLRMVRATKSRTGKAAKKRYARNKRTIKSGGKTGRKLKFGSPAWRAKYMKKK